jgi:hypothetical protein
LAAPAENLLSVAGQPPRPPAMSVTESPSRFTPTDLDLAILEQLARTSRTCTVTEPAAWLDSSRKTVGLHKSIPFRWATTGKAGHKLETIRTPTGVSTTRSAVLRSFAGLTGGPIATPAARTPARRARDVARAEAELAAVGIG